MAIEDLLRHDDADFVQTEHCTRANLRAFPYQREPYVQATVPLNAGNRHSDRPTNRWYEAVVLLHWEDDGRAHDVWVEPENLKWISREESSRKDPSDRDRDQHVDAIYEHRLTVRSQSHSVARKHAGSYTLNDVKEAYWRVQVPPRALPWLSPAALNPRTCR